MASPAGSAKDAAERLRSCQAEGDAEGVATAARALVGAGPSADLLLDSSLSLVSDALSESRGGGGPGGRADEGFLLAASAELLTALDRHQVALRDAESAVSLFHDLKHAAGSSAALRALFRAQLALGSPHEAVRAANTELDAAREANDFPLVAAVLDAVADAHAHLGEPLSAIHAARQAAEMHRRNGSREAEGCSLHTVAKMRWALGEVAEATECARQALAAFVDAKCTAGEEQARTTVSSLLAQRGQLEKAPNRPPAVQALKDLVAAVQNRNEEELRSAEKRLESMRDLVRDREIVERLSPLLKKDPSTTRWLSLMGWNFGDASMDGTHIKQYPHEAFYLHTIVGGMNFGPQFRSVYPYRKGRKIEDIVALEVAQLPDTEAWQMDLGYRPGIIDSAIQNLAVCGYP